MTAAVTPQPQLPQTGSGVGMQQPRTITEIIARAAESPNFDVDKLERLIALKDAEEANQAALFFNNALAAAQGEMGVISHDASNPQTHSRYATYAQLDRAIRQIYTRHGFGIQFTEEPSPNQQTLRVVAFLSCGRETRRFMRDVPITTTGIRGQQMATATHANMSAATYARRALLTMIFNLSTDDDDGNGAGKTIDNTPPQRGAVGKYRPMYQPLKTEPPHDPVTGEVGKPVLVPIDAYNVNGTVEWQQWGSKYIAGVRTATTEGELDEWSNINHDHLERFEKENPAMHQRLTKAVEDQRKALIGDGNNEGT